MRTGRFEPFTLPLLKEGILHGSLPALEALDVGTEASLPAAQQIVTRTRDRGDSRHINQARQAIADIPQAAEQGMTANASGLVVDCQSCIAP